jgi:hypothetical protein
MFRLYRRLQLVLPGIIYRFFIRVGFKKVPENASCLNCEYGFTDGDFKDCDPPGLIPESFYEEYGDDELPKHCGLYKREAI